MQNERIKKVRKALDNGRVSSIEFYSDGSGAYFYYLDPVGDHGCPCTVAASFNINEVMEIVAGFRFRQHELLKCF